MAADVPWIRNANFSGAAYNETPAYNETFLPHLPDGSWQMHDYVLTEASPPQFTSLMAVVSTVVMSFVVALLTLQQAQAHSFTPGGLLSTCGHMSACCLTTLNLVMALLCLLYFVYRVFICDEDEAITYTDPRNPLAQECLNTCVFGEFGDGAFNGVCNDGGMGASNALCALGSDCSDCGVREIPHEMSCQEFQTYLEYFRYFIPMGPTILNPYPDKQMVAAGVCYTVAALFCFFSSNRSLDSYLCPCLVSPAVEGGGRQSSPTERTPLHDDKSSTAPKQ